MTAEENKPLCGCITCHENRVEELRRKGAVLSISLMSRGPLSAGWRYACERCGNKRCPHHTNHIFTCTGSNEPGQVESIYQ